MYFLVWEEEPNGMVNLGFCIEVNQWPEAKVPQSGLTGCGKTT
jgi:hypothetical protein